METGIEPLCSDADYWEGLGASGQGVAEYSMAAYREKLSAFYKEIALP
jgi:hypothetical protein